MCFIWKSRNNRQNKRMRFTYDADLIEELKGIIKKFCEAVEEQYYIPRNVVVYVSSKKLIKALDGDLVVATCFFPDEKEEEIIIRMAAGDYDELIDQYDELNAIGSLLVTLAEQITYMFCGIYYPKLSTYKCFKKAQDLIATHYGKKKVHKYLLHGIQVY